MSTRKLHEDRLHRDAAFERGWTPRRFGKIFYCSPRCGALCTRAAFETATRRAKALCKRLGPGWEPRVWENMGWFYAAEKGAAVVHAKHCKTYPGGVSYMVFFNTAKQIVVSHPSPTRALTLATVSARLAVQRINEDLKVLARKGESS